MKTKQIILIRNNRAGSTIVVGLLVLALLSVVGTTVLMTVSARYNYTQKAVGWQESLGAAEAGADYGLANCRRTLSSGSPSPWSGWKKYDSVSSSWVTVTDAADANSQLTSRKKIVYDLPSDSHLVGTGEGTTDLWFHVEVDAPASMVVEGNQWYRVRSTGYAGLTGLARADNDSPDGAKTHNDTLRKFDLRTDHFIARYGDYAHAAGTTVAVSPQVTRRVEAIAKPTGRFPMAFMTKRSPNSPTVDSYNSTDLVNYPGGVWNSTARNTTTGVGCHGDMYIDSPVTNSAVSAPIFGNVATNGGTVTKTANIYGTVSNNTVKTFAPVTKPPWAIVAGSPQTTLTASAGSTISRSWGSMGNLTVTMPAGSPPGATGVVQIYVSGNITGSITVGTGVTLKIYFEGNVSVPPPTNLNNNAMNMQFYGIDPPAGQSRTFWIDGNNIPDGLVTYFTVDAPGYDMTNNANPNLCGSWIAKSITDNGRGIWHFDEALAYGGDPTDYSRATWVEDER